MGKNHRHKKQVKSEKSKVKLRVKNEKTKFLPKGRNITDLSFKVRQIVLPQQLQEKDGSEIRSKRNLNCKELVSRLRHHNVSSKIEACEELSQILTSHSEELEQNYSIVFKGLCPLMLDVEKRVRRSAVKALDAILGISNQDRLNPFFGVIFSHLKCALTHLDMSIQEDSLKVLDSLLKHSPELVSTHASVLINNLISLTSKQTSSADTQRALTVILGKKLTSTRWRIKVLERILTILRTLREIEQSKVNLEADTLSVQCDNIIYIPLYGGTNALSCSSVVVDPSVQDDMSLFDIFFKNGFISLMLEMWLEETSVEQVKENMTLLNSENAAILSLVLSIILDLWELLRRHENVQSLTYTFAQQFRTPSAEKFWDTILRQFPYGLAYTHIKKQSQEQTPIVTDPDCIKENLMICKLFCTFKSNFVKKLREIETVVSAVENLLSKPKVYDEYLPKLLQEILVEKSEIWTKKGINFKGLLESLVRFYLRLQINPLKIKIFTLLCQISSSQHLNSFINYNSVFKNLPKLVSSDYFDKSAMDSLKGVLRQQNHLLFVASPEDILMILTTIVMSEDKKIPKEKVKMLMEMLIYVPKFSNEHWNMVSEFFKKSKDRSCRNYLETCLDIRKEQYFE